MPNSAQTTRTMVWAIVALVAVTLATVVALEYLGASESVAQVLGILAPVLAVMVTLRQVNQVADKVDATSDKVDQVASDTHDLTNGLLASSVRVGVADVLHPDLVDPHAIPQVATDRATVADKSGEDQ